MTEEELERNLKLLLGMAAEGAPMPPPNLIYKVLDLENHPENLDVFWERARMQMVQIMEEQMFGRGPGSLYIALSQEDQALHEKTILEMSPPEREEQRVILRGVATEIAHLTQNDPDEAKLKTVTLPSTLEAAGFNTTLTSLLRKVMLLGLEKAGLTEYLELMGIKI